MLLAFGEGRTIIVSDVWLAGLSSVWPGEGWRIQGEHIVSSSRDHGS